MSFNAKAEFSELVSKFFNEDSLSKVANGYSKMQDHQRIYPVAAELTDMPEEGSLTRLIHSVCTFSKPFYLSGNGLNEDEYLAEIERLRDELQRSQGKDVERVHEHKYTMLGVAAGSLAGWFAAKEL